jgi:hypothetical protein
MENQKRSDYLSKGSRCQKHFSFESTLPLIPYAVTPYRCQWVEATITGDEPVFWVKSEPCLDVSESIRGSEVQSHSTFADSPSNDAAQRRSGCYTFQDWEPMPADKQKRQHQVRIAALMKSSKLSHSEREFLTSVQVLRSPSRRQQPVLAQIAKSKLEDVG